MIKDAVANFARDGHTPNFSSQNRLKISVIWEALHQWAAAARCCMPSRRGLGIAGLNVLYNTLKERENEIAARRLELGAVAQQ
jgi:hypothetical protein